VKRMLWMSVLKHLICLRYYPLNSQPRGATYHFSPFLFSSHARLLSNTRPGQTDSDLRHLRFLFQINQHRNIHSVPLGILQNSRESGRHNKGISRWKQGQLGRNWTPNRKESFFPFTTAPNETNQFMPKRSGKPKVYAVAVGRQPGLYQTWDECEAQVKGYSKAKFKSFPTTQDAQLYLQKHNVVSAIDSNGSDNNKRTAPDHKLSRNQKRKVDEQVIPQSADVGDTLSTDDHKDSNCTNDPIVLPENSKIQKFEFHINFDGGSRGNPKGVAGSGAHVVTRIHYQCQTSGITTSDSSSSHKLRRKADIRKYLGKGNMTNNQAEYLGAIAGLEHVLVTLQETKAHISSDTAVEVSVHGDSNLVIQQLLGNWQCKNVNMQTLLKQAREVVRDVERLLDGHGSGPLRIHYEHVYRHDNTIADGLANAAMDAEMSWTTITNDSEDNEDDDKQGKKMGKIILV
jgi:ribonuclease HI